MKVVCIDTDVDGLTLGEEYEVIEQDPGFRHFEKFLVKNDRGVDTWYHYNPYGIIKILPATGVMMEYIGEKRIGFTPGKLYHLLDRDGDFTPELDSYYCLDDIGEFRSISRRQLFWRQGAREDKLNQLGL